MYSPDLITILLSDTWQEFFYFLFPKIHFMDKHVSRTILFSMPGGYQNRGHKVWYPTIMSHPTCLHLENGSSSPPLWWLGSQIIQLDLDGLDIEWKKFRVFYHPERAAPSRILVDLIGEIYRVKRYAKILRPRPDLPQIVGISPLFQEYLIETIEWAYLSFHGLVYG